MPTSSFGSSSPSSPRLSREPRMAPHQHLDPLLRRRLRCESHRWQDPTRLSQTILHRQIETVFEEVFPFSDPVMNNLKFAWGGRRRSGVHRSGQIGQCPRVHHEPASWLRHHADRALGHLAQGQRQRFPEHPWLFPGASACFQLACAKLCSIITATTAVEISRWILSPTRGVYLPDHD